MVYTPTVSYVCLNLVEIGVLLLLWSICRRSSSSHTNPIVMMLLPSTSVSLGMSQEVQNGRNQRHESQSSSSSEHTNG